MNAEEKAKSLIDTYLAGTATEEEKILVERFYLDQFKNRPLPDNAAVAHNVKSEIWQGIEGRMQSKPLRRLWPRIAAAASILLCCSIGLYFYQYKKQHVQLAISEIKPGGNKATLTLSSGRQIVLNNVKNGLIARQANTQIQKTADGQLTYSAGKQDTAVQYNTLTTPKGGRYEGILADGTRFILDAASSITYPVQFPASERIVTITGQAYFEVKHDPSRPFKVLAGGQAIQDIGTEFNVNAYADEPAQKNTLVSGSIKVSASGQTLLLKPGQQSIIAHGQLSVVNADIAEAIAWKNGQTTFKDEDLQTIMRQVSRWYDVEVRYEGRVPQREFAGGLSRNADFKDLLKILSFYNVHYTLNNKTLTITP